MKDKLVAKYSVKMHDNICLPPHHQKVVGMICKAAETEMRGGRLRYQNSTEQVKQIYGQKK